MLSRIFPNYYDSVAASYVNLSGFWIDRYKGSFDMSDGGDLGMCLAVDNSYSVCRRIGDKTEVRDRIYIERIG